MMKEENKEKQKEVLNKKQKEAVGKYIESRLGIYDIYSYNFKWEDVEGMIYEAIAEQEVKIQHLGIAKHMIKKCFLSLRVYGEEYPKKIRTHLDYEHPNGGSNGHEMDITLLIHGDGRVYEVER